MISEEKQDQAIAYLLGELQGEEAAAYEQALPHDAELRDFLRETRETLAQWAGTCPKEIPSADLRLRILSIPQREKEGVPVPQMDIPIKPVRRRSARGMVALCLAVIVALAALYDDWSLRREVSGLIGRLDATSSELAAMQQKERTDQAAIEHLQQQPSPLAAVKMVSLASQSPSFGKTQAVVLWDDKNQQGLVKLEGLPQPGSGKSYQLWVIGNSSPAPVSAGLLRVGPDGDLETSFAPNHPVGTAQKFAISIENSGGSDAPKGPIILIGG